jgi:hypothetical protein
MSLYLPEQKLGSHSEPGSSSHKFMLKGRQSGSMHRGHAWVFRAESHDTMLAWFGDIKELTEKTGEARNEFVRRTHARSMSGNSLRPSLGATSSNDGLEEDEADKVPYSTEESIRGPSVSVEAGGVSLVGGLGVSAIHEMEDNRSEAGWRPPQDYTGSARPSAGGRFPSDINIARGLEAPQSPSSGEGFDHRDEDHDIIMAAGALPGGIPFMNSMERHTELQPAYDATTEDSLAGAAGSAAPGIAAIAAVPYTTTHPHAQRAMQAQLGHQDGDFRHPPTASFRAAGDGTSQYGEWMAPIAATVGAGSGAALGAVGLKLHHDHHKQAEEQEAASSAGVSRDHSTHPEAQPIEDVENSKGQMETSTAIPPRSSSNPPITVSVPIESMANDPNDVEPERSLSRPRGVTESTMATTGTAITAAPTLGASSGYAESLSTVPTSVEGAGERESMLVSGGAWEKSKSVSVAGADNDVGMANGTGAPTGLVENVVGANGTKFVLDRLKPTVQRVQTISDLHVPGEFPQAVSASS